jgi:cytoskeletal protein CcmA (bactofilin family)
MPGHISRVLCIFLLILLLTAFTAAPAMAADLRTGDNITIASGEVVNGDLYIGASDITINGTLNGDLWAGGRTITINGTINGAVTCAAQTIIVNGNMARSARLAGQTIVVNSEIKTDLVVAATTLDIGIKARIGGDMVCGCNTIRLDGRIDGEIKGGSGEVNINGGVGKEVRITARKLAIGPAASILGNITYTSEDEAIIQPGAKIAGKIDHIIPEAKKTKDAGASGDVVGKLLTFVIAFVCGTVLILIVPRRLILLAESIRNHPGTTAGWGALLLFVFPIAAIIACITIVGLAVGLIGLGLYGITLYLSQVPVGICIGKLLISLNKPMDSKGLLIGALAIGLAILSLLMAIPVLGLIAGIGSAIFGLGSLITAHIRLRAEKQV